MHADIRLPAAHFSPSISPSERLHFTLYATTSIIMMNRLIFLGLLTLRLSACVQSAPIPDSAPTAVLVRVPERDAVTRRRVNLFNPFEHVGVRFVDGAGMPRRSKEESLFRVKGREEGCRRCELFVQEPQRGRR
ncbi:hypothetical protein B0H16DRAFT_905274 [Mycena metata]|uniref:Uncharacterized protein n=1 Tax=Mycena metata TaxID=1033252 RepID=A0AAD7IQF3_9AGAR|nr:hypothetical protein B0H16DRAFT_905274 [Mycena metata]